MKKNSRQKEGPMIREIKCDLFTPGVLAPVLSGPLFALDHLMGGKSHAVSGALRDQKGNEFDFVGELNGVAFVGREKPLGRPSKDMRNVAAYMAFEWFQVGKKSLPQAAATQARNDLLDYWQNRWPGMPDASTRDTLIRKGKAKFLEVLRTPGDMVRYATYDGTDGFVIVLPPWCTQHRSGESVIGSGEGWVWRYGEEESRFYDFTFRVDLRK
jgi:hypothetical protein